jgi:hypothetical protein
MLKHLPFEWNLHVIHKSCASSFPYQGHIHKFYFTYLRSTKCKENICINPKNYSYKTKNDDVNIIIYPLEHGSK